MTTYPEIRAAGKAMNAKILDATKPLAFDPVRMAKRMTLPVIGRTLVLDDESAQNAFLDFWMHEYRVNGKTLVESVDPVAAGLNPLEAEILAARRTATTSLFETRGLVPNERQVFLHDLLRPERPETRLTDWGFSETVAGLQENLGLFVRVVEVRGFSMTSGFFFGFMAERIAGLLQAYRQRMKKVPPDTSSEQRFVFFFQKSRTCGVNQKFRDAC